MDVMEELIFPDADYTELYFHPKTKTEETYACFDNALQHSHN